jgi:hypothetical protein
MTMFCIPVGLEAEPTHTSGFKGQIKFINSGVSVYVTVVASAESFS